MVEGAPAKKKTFFPAAISNFAKDAAIAATLEKGLHKGIKELSKNKELRRAGTDLIINYARNKNHAHDDGEEEHHRTGRQGSRSRHRNHDYDDDGSDDDRDYRRSAPHHRPSASSSRDKGKAREQVMYNHGSRSGRTYRDDDHDERPHRHTRSKSLSYGYSDFRDQLPPSRPPPSQPSNPPRTRKLSFGDSWLESAFGSAPTWQRGGGFRVVNNRDPHPGAALSRSLSSPGHQRSYSRDGRGYAFSKPPQQDERATTSTDAISPYDVDYRPRLAARREDEEYHRQLRAHQAELGGVAMSPSGVPLYGYRPGEEPGSTVGGASGRGRRNSTSEVPAPCKPGRLARFFSPLSSAVSSPVSTPGGGSGSGGGVRTPIETRLGTYTGSGSGLYAQTFSPARTPPVHDAHGAPVAKDLPAIPTIKTRSVWTPEVRAETRREAGFPFEEARVGETRAGGAVASYAPEGGRHRGASQTPAVVSPSIPAAASGPGPTAVHPPHPSATARFPIPSISADTPIQTLVYAARCSQLIYHLSTPTAVKHYLRQYDSHASNPSLLEARFADPARGTKNWALLRRKADGALVLAVRGSGRGLARGADYGQDLGWLDDEEWLSDMMLNLRARKWGGGGGEKGSLSRRNSTGGAVPSHSEGGKTASLGRSPSSSSRQPSPSASASASTHHRKLHLSSIRCADGSAFEAHEGFLRCAMAMYAEVARALEKKVRMWMVLGAAAGVRVEHGGRGAPGTSTSTSASGEGGEGGEGGKGVPVGKLESVSPPELILTGHSAGGAVASLLYVLLDTGSRELLDRFGKVSVLTFGPAAAFPPPRSAPLTHANTHPSRRALTAYRVRDVHVSVLHVDDPVPRMDGVYALTLLEGALGGPRHAQAALLGLSALAGSGGKKGDEVGELVRLLREGAARAEAMRRREREARRMDRAAEEVVGGGVPSARGERPSRLEMGMELWPAGELYLLAPALASSSSSSSSAVRRTEGGGDGVDAGTLPRSILKGGQGPPPSPPQSEPGAMALYRFSHAQLARSTPADWASHRIGLYFHLLEAVARRMPGLRL